MSNLSDLIQKAKKQLCPDTESAIHEVGENLGINLWGVSEENEQEKRLQTLYLRVWYCTDTWVGTKAYFFDGEFVAVSDQIGRKYQQEFQWVSVQAYKKVKEYLLSLTKEEEDIPLLEEADLEQDLGPYYHVNYEEQLLPRIQSYFYQGKPVEYIRKDLVQDPPSRIVTIQCEGVQSAIPVEHLDIEYLTKRP
jgi:hypothetical protein